MTNDEFEKACRGKFQFLESDFGFRLFEVKKDDYGVLVTYSNPTTAVRISYEPFDGGVFVTISKVVGGIPATFPIFYDRNSELLAFDLNDLLYLRSRRRIKQDPRLLTNPSHADLILKELADGVLRHGVDVLNGDFLVLAEIKKMVDSRI